MNNIVPINQARMPSTMRARIAAGKTTNSNFSGGIRDAFPMLSIKGKVFRIRKDGQETPLVDPATRQVIPFLDVILVNAAPTLSKAYYLKGFDDGDMSPPDCWSLDSVKPDPSVANKINPTCANCPMNIFGSAQSNDPAGGKRGGKACGDGKRIAVMMPSHLGKPEPLIFLLKVPATSLKNLKGYSDLLARQGWEPAACVTRLQFDYQQAYPKLEFHFVDSLDDGEYDEVVAHAEGPYIASMLAAPDFDAGLSHPATNPAVQPRVRQGDVVLDDTQTVVEEKPKPRQAEPVAQAQPQPAEQQQEPTLIELPTGELMNPTTGEVFPAPVPETKVEAVKDPRTIVMQDGRFFNMETRQFVTGPNVGDPPVGAPAAAPAAEPVKRTRAKKAKEEPVAQAQPEAAQPVAQEAKPAANGNGQVTPAPSDMDALLKDLIPTRNS